MRTSAALRYSAYISFIFALMCTVPAFMQFTGIFACCMVLWTAVCILASRLKSPLARAIAALLSCIALAIAFWSRLAENPISAICTAIVGVIFTVLMALGRFDVEYWRFRRTFIFLFSASAFITAIEAIVYIAVTPTTRQWINLDGTVAFTFICALVGVFVLSELRKGDADAKWKAMNAGRIVAILAIVSAVLVALYLLLAFTFSRITPIIGRIAQRRQPNYATYESRRLPYSQQANTPGGHGEVKDQLEDREIMVPADEKADKSVPWWVYASGSVLVAGCAALIVIRIRKRRKAKALLQGDFSSGSEEKIPDNVMKIRDAYKQYISFVKEHGGELSRGSTSEDILETSSQIGTSSSEAEAKLREIYIKARYANPESVTDEDVRLFMELLETITSSYTDESK